MPTASEQGRPVIIVTGANKLRDLSSSPLRFCQTSPDDALSVLPHSGVDEQGIEYPCAGLTLIMACRSRRRAEAARTQLLELFESDVARLRGATDTAERVAAFRANLVVAIHTLDLALVQSTLAFADEVARTYPYVSHLNILELDLLDLVTNPSYDVQHTALMSDDGLGCAWQCNVFGPLHSCARPLIACQELEAKLAASPIGPGRVVWMSSHAADPDVYDPDDWQLVDSSRPYEGTKFQMDLIRAELSRRAGPSSPIRHFTVHPGVVAL
ncbi:hypothetical protein F5148DRAFT_1294528 [Russula earlei]|uniref:Uncharacterized protein n=1 Tax=Russula earlei TaxID=71964 RepID=A0ACC0TRQ7_9AGAM|nr:hypothetical protein F5148DRAFT_1294528 [Russula earlei]